MARPKWTVHDDITMINKETGKSERVQSPIPLQTQMCDSDYALYKAMGVVQWVFGFLLLATIVFLIVIGIVDY